MTRGDLARCPTSKYLSCPSTTARACHNALGLGLALAPNALGPGLAPRLSKSGPGGYDGWAEV